MAIHCLLSITLSILAAYHHGHSSPSFDSVYWPGDFCPFLLLKFTMSFIKSQASTMFDGFKSGLTHEDIDQPNSSLLDEKDSDDILDESSLPRFPILQSLFVLMCYLGPVLVSFSLGIMLTKHYSCSCLGEESDLAWGKCITFQ